MKYFFLSLTIALSLVPAFVPVPVSGVGVCDCRIILRKENSAVAGAPECDFSGTKSFALGDEFSPKRIIEDVSPIECPAAGSFAAEVEAQFAPFTLSTDAQCGSIDVNTAVGGYSTFIGGCSFEGVKNNPAGTQQVIHLINPIGGKDGTDQEKAGITDLNVIIGKLIKAALGIVGSLTLVVFMYGGFQWLTSRGNSEQIRAGLDAMLYAAVGIFIIFSSYAILTTIFNGLK